MSGPLTRSVADARLALRHLVGHDRGDPVSAAPETIARLRTRLARPTRVDLRGLRVGLLDDDPLFEIIEPRAQRAYDGLLTRLAENRVRAIPLQMSELRYVLGTVLALMFGDAAVFTSSLRKGGTIAADDLRTAIHVAHVVPAGPVARAHQVRRHIADAVGHLFRAYRLDVLLTPATVAPAIPRDGNQHTLLRKDGTPEDVLWWAYARPLYLANVTGQPAIVMPTVNESPPLGIQLMGRPYHDDRLLDIAAAVEELEPISLAS